MPRTHIRADHAGHHHHASSGAANHDGHLSGSVLEQSIRHDAIAGTLWSFALNKLGGYQVERALPVVRTALHAGKRALGVLTPWDRDHSGSPTKLSQHPLGDSGQRMPTAQLRLTVTHPPVVSEQCGSNALSSHAREHMVKAKRGANRRDLPHTMLVDRRVFAAKDDIALPWAGLHNGVDHASESKCLRLPPNASYLSDSYTQVPWIPGLRVSTHSCRCGRINQRSVDVWRGWWQPLPTGRIGYVASKIVRWLAHAAPRSAGRRLRRPM